MRTLDGRPWMRQLAMLLGLLLLLAALNPPTLNAVSSSGDWGTKGGTFTRPNRTDELQGIGFLEEWWSQEMGASASQPIMVENAIYHLSGPYLWKITLDDQGRPSTMEPVQGSSLSPPKVNADPDPPRSLEVPFSTPTYSPSSGVIYFGTPWGSLWAYQIEANLFREAQLQYPCRIIGSPLVLQIDGKEIVVVGDKPADDCPGGTIWAVWGLDDPDPNAQVYKTHYSYQGWVTPSPIPGPAPHQFIIGADGVPGCGGRASIISIVAAGPNQYDMVTEKSICRGTGFAGGLALDNSHVHWTDTSGKLFGFEAGIREPLWPDIEGTGNDEITLPRRIAPAGTGFTNTAPAIGTDGTIYVALRNFRDGQRDTFTLRGCGNNDPAYGEYECSEPGAPGALIAINPDGSTKWTAQLPTDGSAGTYRSLNTTPLLIESRGIVVVGDVNGSLYAYWTDSGKPAPFVIDGQGNTPPPVGGGQQSAIPLPLLKPGEIPARADRTYSQRTGVGSDPMSGGGLLITGVNFCTTCTDPSSAPAEKSRLVAYRSGGPYNLHWRDGALHPTGPLTDDALSVIGTVRFQTLGRTAGQRLDDLRPDGIRIEWYVTDKPPFDAAPPTYLRKLPDEYPLPPAMQHGSAAGINQPLRLTPDDPLQGYIVGVIDRPTLAVNTGHPAGDWATAATAQMGLARLASAPANSEVIRLPDGTDALRDNFIALPYQRAVNLSVRVDAPAEITYDPTAGALTYQATVRVQNLTGTTITAAAPVPLTLLARTPDGIQQIDDQIALAPYQSLILPYDVTISMCGSHITEAKLNMRTPRTYGETSYSDNLSTAQTLVTCTKPPPPSTFNGGEGRTIIVPADCSVIGDPNDQRLCANYRKRTD